MVCDPRVAYIVVLRPAEEDQTASGVTALFPGLIGRSSAMDGFRLVENLEHSEATVLLTGESGNWQGDPRPHHSRPLSSAQWAVRGRELRSPAR